MGIDVGTKTVRAAMIQRRGKALKLQALVAAPRGNGSLDDALKSVKKQLRKACKAPCSGPSIKLWACRKATSL